MAQTLRLRTNEAPTVFNKEMAIGLLGAALFTGGMGFLGAITVQAIGAIAGGYFGKNRMENELRVGKPVSDKPSFWNKTTLLGGLIGHYVGLAAALITGALGLAGTAGAAAAGASEVAIGAGLLGTAGLAVAAAVGVTALGVYLGGRKGQKEERENFAVAAMQQPEVFRQPGYAMDMNPAFAAQIEQERAQAAQQEKAR